MYCVMQLLELLVNQHRMDQAVSRGETHLISDMYDANFSPSEVGFLFSQWRETAAFRGHSFDLLRTLI